MGNSNLSLPLYSHGKLGATVAFVDGQPRSAAHSVAAAHAIAARISHRADAVINLCDDRYLFWCVLMAAAISKRVAWLPSAQSEQMLRDMLEMAPRATVLSDRPLVIAGADLVMIDHRIIAHSPPPPQPLVEPTVTAEQGAIVALTSGSTGKPQPHPKSWGSLFVGARSEALALELIEPAAEATGSAIDTPRFNLLGTVPPQHMYGIESTLMLAVRNGAAFSNERPLLPHDVAAALARLPEPRVLVTTPIHLRALLAARAALPALKLILSAAAPLPVELARAAEQRLNAPVKEIYGFTEAGQVAHRRSTVTSAWTTLPGVVVQGHADHSSFSGGHIPGRQASADIIELHSPTEFSLRGRSQDLLNIAGKRASLADLNLKLLAVDGVRDGAFYLPEAPEADAKRDAATQRLMAFVVAPGLTSAQIGAALRKQIDPVFLPRPIVHCEALPRNATGKLTLEALRRLEAQARKDRLRRFSIDADHPSLPGHFPGRPIVPGVLILAYALASAPFQRDELLGIAQLKFLSPLLPGEPCEVTWSDGGRAMHCRVGERLIARAQFKLRETAR